jgi:hypothetical protein
MLDVATIKQTERSPMSSLSKLSLPAAAQPLFDRFSVAFSQPTFQRFVLLSIGSILAMGRRTTTALLWTVRSAVQGHPSSYHRVFSRSPWSPWRLGKVLAAVILELIPADQPVILSVDDTVAQHKGKHVYGKGCHHDAVRSTHTHIVWKWGHKWVVLAINVKFPFANRAWALPVLCALYKPMELDRTEGHRHRTLIDLARGLVAALIHWFPGRRFVLLGDGGYASHELARFARHHCRHLILVSRFHGDANLYAPPPKTKRRGVGRPRVKGRKLASPDWIVAHCKRTKAKVGWYGGGQRKIEFVSQSAHWYKGGGGLVPLRWVFVHDRQGTHRDEYFYCTDPNLSPQEIVTLFTTRWSIEVTFQEVREHLGFETTKQHCSKSILRTGPCLLSCYSVVTLVYAKLVEHSRPILHNTPSYSKSQATFSDALYAVRRCLWDQAILKQAIPEAVVAKLPAQFMQFMLDQLSTAG